MRHCVRMRTLPAIVSLLLLNLATAGRLQALDEPALPPIDASTRLLVVSPHPDDETLCCGGAIARVVHAGGQVSIVWLTNGDATRLAPLLLDHALFPNASQALAMGELRLGEARAATARLGVPAVGQIFLGYPDRGLLALLTRYRTQSFLAPLTRTRAVPYAAARFPGHAYTGEDLRRDFESVLRAVQPTLILAPSPLDAHPDHRAGGLLTLEALRSLTASTQVRYWIVHAEEGWPSPRGLNAGIPLFVSARARVLAPVDFALSFEEEDEKRAALEAYDSQMRVMAPFLLAFVRSSELYSQRAQAAAPH
jgi:LmbE family N-acetylglucosaminyl deacetylase